MYTIISKDSSKLVIGGKDNANGACGNAFFDFLDWGWRCAAKGGDKR